MFSRFSFFFRLWSLMGAAAWVAAIWCVELRAQEPTAQGPEREGPNGRSEIVLNGVWRFLPEANKDAAAPPGGGEWGLMQVPGSWWPERRTFGKLLVKQPGWNINDNSNAAWYQRMLEIPESWQGREIVLELERVSTDAKVWVDGKPAGELPWPGGELDITALVTPGQTARLEVLVTSKTAGPEFEFMGIGQNVVRQARLSARGIIGDTFLRSRPKGPRVDGVFVQPSVRKKQLGLDVEMVNVPASVRSVQVSAKAVPVGGGESVEFPAVEVKVERAGEFAVAKAAWPWENPKLWDVRQPNLYDLEITVSGQGIADSFVQRFGFREWWIEGRKAFLNGVEIRPQVDNIGDNQQFGYGVRQAAEAEVAQKLDRNITLAWLWPESYFARSRTFWQKNLVEAADNQGLLMLGNLVRLNEYMRDAQFRNTWEQGRKPWEEAVSKEWRKFRNNPSIIGWILAGNMGPRFQDQNPRLIGRRGWDPMPDIAGLADAQQFFHQMDPTRIVVFGAGAYEGDIYSAMTYLNFTPLQEREQWLTEWAKEGEMPYIGIEFGTPLPNSFMRGRNSFRPSGETEPLVAEFSAIYLGPEAYKLESQRYRRQIRTKYQSGEKFQSFNFDEAMETDPALQAIQQLFIRNTWRSWRAHNAGWVGMIAWHNPLFYRPNPRAEDVALPPFKPGDLGSFPATMKANEMARSWREPAFRPTPSGPVLLEAQAPTMAWIGGGPSDFTDKTRHYRAGATVEKQIVIVNDTRQAQPYKANWKTTGLAQNAQGTLEGQIPPGQSLTLPISFPAVASQHAKAAIELEASVGDASHTDAFAFEVFPPVEPPTLKGPVALWDPEGKTTALLKAWNISTTPWTGQAAALLIVGRNALGGGHQPPASLEEFVSNGGRLLIMTQDPEWLRSYLGFRIGRQSLRHFWPVRAEHPVMAGLTFENLRDWAGSSTLLEPRPEYPKDKFPEYGWRWGQQHALSAAPVEKPHLAGWRPILEGGFDLQYSPLMELDYGKGRAILCTLDFEDYPDEPPARILGQNLLKYAAEAPLRARASGVVLIGDANAEKFLQSLGLKFETGTSLDGGTQLAIIAHGADVPQAAIDAFLQKGGRILFLASHKGGEAHFGANVKLAKNFSGSLNPPNAPEADGLSPSDLRFKTDADARVIDAASPGLEVGADGLLAFRRVGKGVAVYCQLDPTALDADNKQYFRLTRWRHTRAITQLLANLGAEFAADARAFRPFVERVSLAGPWKVRFTKELPLTTWENKHEDPGITPQAQALAAPDADESGFQSFDLPANHPRFDEVCGEAVWRKTVVLPDAWEGQIVNIHIPAIKSYDTVFWNGRPVGSTSKDTQKDDPWNLPRRYRVPGNLVKAGPNTIVIRQFAPDKSAGVHGRAEDFYLRLISTKARPASFYHPDYRESFETGDEPARYYRW